MRCGCVDDWQAVAWRAFAKLAVPDLAMVPRLLSRSSLVMPTPVSLQHTEHIDM